MGGKKNIIRLRIILNIIISIKEITQMELKGTKTEKNLMAAFAGES